ncbi:tol-pal system-associated acyl-CoA thioesterase [Stakelama marina]|uniref:Tol-pal system-associated acyl-CoA thioesterase n=1 Tax=Stakelama marina TaxID=2826939 RepID=A0A8T4ICA7_9SPHN|nr:tol-pal system-associated acyl-CoA thioesterase [Stakelama marina]MBR0552277.1 tol-pal system-associated acyl-CoA thioesterase [Stakelama marina]
MSDADQPAEGRFDGVEHRFPVRIYFEDTDLSGIVYHANYLRYMERARSDMLRLAGVDQRAAFEAGEGAYAVRRMDMKFVAPAKLDDALVVVSRLCRVRAAAVDIHQTVMRSHAILVEADVEAAFVAPTGRPRRQPAEWVRAYEPLIWKGN